MPPGKETEGTDRKNTMTKKKRSSQRRWSRYGFGSVKRERVGLAEFKTKKKEGSRWKWGREDGIRNGLEENEETEQDEATVPETANERSDNRTVHTIQKRAEAFECT